LHSEITFYGKEGNDAKGSFVITMKAWNRTPEKYQKPLEEKMIGLEAGFNEELTRNNTKCLRAMIKYGIKEVKLTPEEIELLKKIQCLCGTSWPARTTQESCSMRFSFR
jgi:TRAP-type C4-dicarboxylate transport system substrate-binding protein